MSQQIAENWISITEAATHLGVKVDTIRAWIKKTDIPAHRRIRNKGWYALSASQNQSNRGGSNFSID